jgi:hypothetical protein
VTLLGVGEINQLLGLETFALPQLPPPVMKILIDEPVQSPPLYPSDCEKLIVDLAIRRNRIAPRKRVFMRVEVRLRYAPSKNRSSEVIPKIHFFLLKSQLRLMNNKSLTFLTGQKMDQSDCTLIKDLFNNN